MKEETQFWFQRLACEDGFDPDEVSSTEVGKRKIDTHVIFSAVNLKEGRERDLW